MTININIHTSSCANMSGLIRQRADVIDPRTLPDFEEEGSRMINAMHIDIDRMLETGERPSGEITSIARGEELGKIIFPPAIHALDEVLHFSDIYIRPSIADGVDATPLGPYTTDQLIDIVRDLRAYSTSFEASVTTDLDLGTQQVRVEFGRESPGVMRYLLGRSIQLKRPEQDADLPDFLKRYFKRKDDIVESYQGPIPRLMVVLADYQDPLLAQPGLHSLEQAFPGIIFEEELYLFPLPKELLGPYEELHNAVKEALFGTMTDEEFDKISRSTHLLHFTHYIPLLQDAGIVPIRARLDNKDDSDFFADVAAEILQEDTEPDSKYVDVQTFTEAVPLYEDPAYMSSVQIEAQWQGRDITLSFAHLYTPYGRYGLRIENNSSLGTLEALLTHTQ